MTLRIIAGKYRRRRLAAPADRRIRPTLERVREAAFNVLAHGVPGARPLPEGVHVLDLFAGSGAMGFEALSRGAASVTFLEKDKDALALLRQNAAELDASARVQILRADATRPGRLRDAAGVAFLDPPYGQNLGPPTLTALREAGGLLEGAVIVIEIGAKETFNPPSGFRPFDERRYGTAKLVFLLHEGVAE